MRPTRFPAAHRRARRSTTSHTPLSPPGLREALQRKDSSLLRKNHFIELAALWGFKSEVWRLRGDAKRPRASAERAQAPSGYIPAWMREEMAAEAAAAAAAGAPPAGGPAGGRETSPSLSAQSPAPSQPLLSPPPPSDTAHLSQLPDGLEAQLRASAAAYEDLPLAERLFSFLSEQAAVRFLDASAQLVAVMAPFTLALAQNARANHAALRAAVSAMSPEQLAEPHAWMARSQELPRVLDEHLVFLFAGVAANGASIRAGEEILRTLPPGSQLLPTVCEQAYAEFIKQSNSDMARFVSQAQSCLALMRQESCGRFFAACCLVGELLVDVLEHLVALMGQHMRCLEEREASAQLLQLAPAMAGGEGLTTQVLPVLYKAYTDELKGLAGTQQEMMDKVADMMQRL